MVPDPISAQGGNVPAGADVLDPESVVVCHISTTPGAGNVTLWHSSELDEDLIAQGKLQLSPDQPAVIGRSQGTVPYLDPSYRPTRLVPGTGQDIMRSADGRDGRHVSRAHFMLRAAGRSVLLVNGVPRPDGGLRPPLCGTWLMLPERRPMGDCEEYLVESGTTAMIALPNGVLVQLSPE
jgi:hypothetical protein